MTKSKSVIATVALALAGVIGIGYVGASVACNSWNPVQWVNRTPTEITRPADDESKSWGIAVNTATGEVLKETETYALPMGVMFMSERSESEIATAEYTAPTITFTAAINNEYLNIPLTLPESTEYLEVTPVNANTFTVKCLKPFGEKQKLTVTSPVTSSIKLECEVDYLKRLIYMDGTESEWVSFRHFGDTIGCYRIFEKGIGTVEATGYQTRCSVHIDNTFVDILKNYLTFDIEILDYHFSIDSNKTAIEDKNGGQLVSKTDDISIDYDDVIKDFYNFTEPQQKAIKTAWHLAEKDCEQSYGEILNVWCEVYVDYIFNNKIIYSEPEKDFNKSSYTNDSELLIPEGEALDTIVTLTPDNPPIL